MEGFERMTRRGFLGALLGAVGTALLVALPEFVQPRLAEENPAPIESEFDKFTRTIKSIYSNEYFAAELIQETPFRRALSR